MESIVIPEDIQHYKDIYVVFEPMEADLSKIIRSSQNLTDTHFQYFMIQILSALVYMHSLGIFIIISILSHMYIYILI
jgi:serine/threonine protein kinase